MSRANIRAQRQAQGVTPRQAAGVPTQEFNVPSLAILRALPSPWYQDNFKLSRGAGAAPQLPSRGSSGFAQALSQHAATQAESAPCWQQGGGRDTERLMASLDCHTELRKAQPWQEGAAPPAVFQGAQEQDTASPCCPQPLPFSPSLGSPGCPNHPSCRLWEQLGHLRLLPR